MHSSPAPAFFAPPDLHPFVTDPALPGRLLSPEVRLIMVVGEADTGKTTLVERLAGFLSRDRQVGVVDADMGQSHIGPPATIGWGTVEGGFEGWEQVTPRDLYFTGAFSPVGNLVPSLAGARFITALALQRCPVVVVDTTGLVNEPAGRVLKQYKIEMLRPQVVLVLERCGELEHILAPYRFSGPAVYRLRVPGAVGAKQPPERASYRRELLRSYLEEGGEETVRLDRVGVRFTRNPFPLEERGLVNRMVSLRNEAGRDLAVGVATGISGDELAVRRGPRLSGDEVALLMVGAETAAWEGG
ncbi:MAG: Clp1/GlmU family protein [Spirochaetota bacterium]